MPGNILKFFLAMGILLSILAIAIGQYGYGFTHAAEDRDRILAERKVTITDDLDEERVEAFEEVSRNSRVLRKNSQLRDEIERMRGRSN